MVDAVTGPQGIIQSGEKPGLRLSASGSGPLERALSSLAGLNGTLKVSIVPAIGTCWFDSPPEFALPAAPAGGIAGKDGSSGWPAGLRGAIPDGLPADSGKVPENHAPKNRTPEDCSPGDCSGPMAG